VVDAMDGEVTRNWVEDAIETGLEKYDPADSRYFSDAVNDLISDSDRLKSLVRDVLTDNSFELVMS
jgi:hypothetical protein